MSIQKTINASLKTGKEAVTFKGRSLGFNVLQFWQWSTSGLLSNAIRGVFAEFIVPTAVVTDLKIKRSAWDAYDLVSPDRIKIEVKSAAFLQSWEQKKHSSISFSIKPSKKWDSPANQHSGAPKRQADVYVFCLLAEKDRIKVDPLKMEQWRFFVLATSILDQYYPGGNRISLTSLKKYSEAAGYPQLQDAVKEAYHNQMGALS